MSIPNVNGKSIKVLTCIASNYSKKPTTTRLFLLVSASFPPYLPSTAPFVLLASAQFVSIPPTK